MCVSEDPQSENQSQAFSSSAKLCVLLNPEAEMENRPWPRRVIRSVGIANIIFAAFGFWLLIGTVANFLRIHAPNPTSAPYSHQVFGIMTTANVCFLLILAFAGLRLVQLRFAAIRMCNFLFAAEIIYFLTMIFLEAAGLSETVLRSMAMASGGGGHGNRASDTHRVSGHRAGTAECGQA